MNILRKVLLAIPGVKGLMTSGMSYSVGDPEFGGALARVFGTSTASGRTVNEGNAMTVSAFWGCVRVITETFGGLPGAVFEKDPRNGNMTRIDHDVGQVLFESPNRDMTKVEFHEAIGGNLAQQGNAISIADRRSDGSVLSLYPIRFGHCTVGMKDGEIHYDINDRGKWITYPRDKIWHIKGFGMDGLVGLSPLAYARQALGMAMSAEEFQAKFFANGASPSLIISVPQWLDEKQRAKARENLEKLWGGVANAHGARLLEGGMTPHPTAQKLQEAQFAELRGFTVAEICRFMRVPPHLVMDLSRSTNNNIEHQGLEWLQSMMTYSTRVESSCTKWLFKPEERKSLFLKYNLDSTLRVDSAGRASLYNILLQNGVLTRNEVRALENRNRSEDVGMDDFTVQMNLTPVKMLQLLAEAVVKKGEVPAAPPPQKSADIYLTNNMPPQETKVVTLGDNNTFAPVDDIPRALASIGKMIHTVQRTQAEELAAVMGKVSGSLQELKASQEADTVLRKMILNKVEDAISEGDNK